MNNTRSFIAFSLLPLALSYWLKPTSPTVVDDALCG
jgi:hypothetical protein